MNVRSLAATSLGLGAAAEALRYTPQRNRRLPALAFLWAVHVLSALWLAARSPRFIVPRSLRRLGLPLMVIGSALGLYSAVIERTREGRGSEPGEDSRPSLRDLTRPTPETIAALEEPPRDGTYRASRHPALLGYAGFLTGLTLFSGSFRLLISTPLWIAAAVGQATLREEVLRRDHGWYDDYARSTPMLLPTRESARSAFEDLRERFRQGTEEAPPSL